MGVINITQRQNGMGTISSGVMPHGFGGSATNSGSVRNAQAKLYFVNRYANGAQDANRIAHSMERLYGTVRSVKDEWDRDDANKLANLYISRSHEALNDNAQDSDGNVKGLMLREGEQTKTMIEDFDKLRTSMREELKKEYGEVSNRAWQTFEERISRYDASNRAELQARQHKEYKRQELMNVQSLAENMIMEFNDGKTELVDDVLETSRELWRKKGMNEQAIKTSEDKLKSELLYNHMSKRMLGSMHTVQDWDALGDDLKDGNVNNSALIETLLPVNDPARRLAGNIGTDGLGEVLSARLRDVYERERRTWERDKTLELNADIARFEIDFANEKDGTAYPKEISDESLQKHAEACASKWNNYFNEIAPKYGDVAPQTIARIKERADKANEALSRVNAVTKENKLKAANEKIRQEREFRKLQVKDTEERLNDSLIRMQILDREGILTQEHKNEYHEKLWNKFRACALDGSVSPSFKQSFIAKFTGQLSDIQRDAVIRLYREFGFDAKLDSEGFASDKARRDAESDTTAYYAPHGKDVNESDYKVSATQVIQFADEVTRELQRLPPGVNPQGAVEKLISDVKMKWVKEQFDQNKVNAIQSLFTTRQGYIQRNPSNYIYSNNSKAEKETK